jgi:hypothetical protein
MKPKVLFIFRHEYESLWQDGLWRALQVLSFDYEITLHNLMNGNVAPYKYDFVLGWGAFGSAVDNYMQPMNLPKGLCIAGVAQPPKGSDNYNVLFYETEWYRPTIESHRNIIHAFGINTDIYKPSNKRKFWDYVTVGAFASWKRQHLLIDKPGYKLAVGEIQKGNPVESFGIIAKLLGGNVMISDMLEPKKLAEIYCMSKTMYMPSDIFGGGERAILEARACGCEVEIEPDNPKLDELTRCPIWDHNYYAERLKEGIDACLL